jgi:hypothetical protein
MVEVLEADDVEKANYEDMVLQCYMLIRKYNVTRVYIDGSNPAFIQSLTRRIAVIKVKAKNTCSSFFIVTNTF